jgi:MYXO-CTERM domain-containing protein
MARTGCVRVLGAMLLASAVAANAGAQPLLAEVEGTWTIPAGGYLIVRVDPAAGTAIIEQPSRRDLSAVELEAVAAVPAWLAPDLAAAFARLTFRDDPEGLAQLILDAEDPAYVDELGFLIAHLAPEDLVRASSSRMDRGIIPEIVRGIYERDADINFADLVEHGTATDPDRYTTVAYRALRDGEPVTFELPRDVYYWNVVHPVLDGESVQYIDPACHFRTAPPAGKHWRDYLWTDDPDRSYQAADVLVSPDRITAATFSAWSLGATPRATSHFTDLEVGPIELVRADSGEPVTISFTRGDQSCGNNDRPNADGMYFATLSPVELAASTGLGSFLSNLVRAGGGNAELLPSDIVSWDGPSGAPVLAPRDVLIVRDRIPYDMAADPTEVVLTGFGRRFDVLTSAELDALVLSPSAAPLLNTTYNKIIVPSDQPRALYEALVRNTEKLERFVDYGGIFELHGATRPADDWSDLRMPGGIRCASQDGSNAHDVLVTYGYPLLADIVPQAEYLWDFVPQMGLPGDRAFDPAGSALERLGWWISQNLTWNIQEKVCWKRGAVAGRYLTPQEIVFDHFGNCGELQDMWSGGGRSLLVAIWNTGTVADDHMWNEFWQGEQWLPVQVDWSDNDTRLGNWGVAYDADTGGSKTISGMDGFRGDGLSVPALGRYAPTELDGHLWNDYSQHVTLVATVEDAAGNPVDGAQVLIATPSLYDETALTIATAQTTGPDGVARVVVGEGNNFYVQINSSLGSYPDATRVEAWVTAAEAVADAEFSRTFTLDGTLAPPEPEVVPPAGELLGRVVADVSVDRELVHGTSFLSGRTYTEPYDSGDVQAWLLTGAAYDAYVAGEGLSAAALGQRGRDVALDEELRGVGPFVLFVANMARAATEQEAAIQVAVYGPAAADADAGDDVPADVAADGGEEADGDGGPVDVETGGSGCACAVRGPATPGGAAWLFLAALFLLRRRR